MLYAQERYRSIFKGMIVTCTACNTHNDCRQKTYRTCQRLGSLSLHDVVFFSFITSLKSNLSTVLTTQNTTENNSHAQNTTALRPTAFLVGIHRMLVTSQWGKSAGAPATLTRILRNMFIQEPDVDGRIILRWIFRKWEGVVGTG